MLKSSNGYLLNHALLLAKKYYFFTHLSQHQIEIFLIEISRISDGFDCILGEVFNKIGGEFGFCYICKKSSEAFIDDICETCDNKLFYIGTDEKDDLLSKVQKLKLEGRKLERHRIAQKLIKNGIDKKTIQEAIGIFDEEMSHFY